MGHIKNITLLIALIALPFLSKGQFRVSNDNSELSVFGTSTIHDWEIVAEKLSGDATFNAENLSELKDLNFAVKVEGLNSGKSAMDDNTYEALEEKKYPNVVFNLTEVKSVSSKGSNKFQLNTSGKLTIAGTTKSISMPVMAEVNGSTVNFYGDYSLKMTDFNIEPPTAVFGTIKTGDEVTIKFNVQYSNNSNNGI